MVTMKEANSRRLCLVCGAEGALLLMHRDGRYLRACVTCLRSDVGEEWLCNTSERQPLPCEERISQGTLRFTKGATDA